MDFTHVQSCWFRMNLSFLYGDRIVALSGRFSPSLRRLCGGTPQPHIILISPELIMSTTGDPNQIRIPCLPLQQIWLAQTRDESEDLVFDISSISSLWFGLATSRRSSASTINAVPKLSEWENRVLKPF